MANAKQKEKKVMLKVKQGYIRSFIRKTNKINHYIKKG